MSIPAGWYDDGSGAQRWWDGQGWTEHLGESATPTADADAVAVEVQPPSPTATQPSYAQQQYTQQQYAMQPASTNGLAITSLVLGILGFGIIPVIFGHIALSQIKRNPQQQGRGLAIAGLILGYIAAAFWVIFIGIMIFGLLFSVASSVAYR